MTKQEQIAEMAVIGCCCALFNVELESDNKNHYYCKRCDECKRAEVKDEHSSN